MASPLIEVIVSARTLEAPDIVSFRLVGADGTSLPSFAAGAHIEVHTPAGPIRAYSLLNAPRETAYYEIAVRREAASRGGSAAMHMQVKTGDRLLITSPRNLFALDETAASTLLFAGGIGITPMLAMAARLSDLGRAFDLHYSVRSRETAAFLRRLAEAPFATAVHAHFDDGDPAHRLDVDAVLEAAPPDTHLYVCGPSGFMQHVLDAAGRRGWPQARLHREYFSAAPMDHSADGAFVIRAASSGAEITVPPGRTALSILLENGFEIPMSCEQGVCGTCLTRVLDGIPDHRDLFMTEDEQAANDCFTPCCSRARTPVLLLDI